jgi:hypothetical protein
MKLSKFLPFAVVTAVLAAVLLFAVNIVPMFHQAAVPATVSAAPVVPDQWNPANMLSVPDSTRRESRSFWSSASNGDLPISPMHAAIFAAFAALAIPLIPLFKMIRSGSKEVEKSKSELARTTAANRAAVASSKGGFGLAADPWSGVGPRG